MDKVSLSENPDIPEINKVTAQDMNKIKKVVNQNFETLEETVLYDNADGTINDFILSDNVGNYESIEVFYHDNQKSMYQSLKIYNPEGSTAQCQFGTTYQNAQSHVYFNFYWSQWKFNGTNATKVGTGTLQTYDKQINNANVTTSVIYIYRVVGSKKKSEN